MAEKVNKVITNSTASILGRQCEESSLRFTGVKITWCASGKLSSARRTTRWLHPASSVRLVHGNSQRSTRVNMNVYQYDGGKQATTATVTAENRGRDSASISRAIPAGLAKSHASVHDDKRACNVRPGWRKRAWAYTKSRAAAARSIAGPRRGPQAVSQRGHPANVRASGCGRERAAAFGVADMPAR